MNNHREPEYNLFLIEPAAQWREKFFADPFLRQGEMSLFEGNNFFIDFGSLGAPADSVKGGIIHSIEKPMRIAAAKYFCLPGYILQESRIYVFN
jgi:hypothetical protein